MAEPGLSGAAWGCTMVGVMLGLGVDPCGAPWAMGAWGGPAGWAGAGGSDRSSRQGLVHL